MGLNIFDNQVFDVLIVQLSQAKICSKRVVFTRGMKRFYDHKVLEKKLSEKYLVALLFSPVYVLYTFLELIQLP